MMLTRMVGHASFHTADVSGPSTIERSYRRVPVDVRGAAPAFAARSDPELPTVLEDITEC